MRVNLSGSGVGMSFGMKGLRAGVDSKGRQYVSGGVPGTGIYFREYAKTKKNRNSGGGAVYPSFRSTTSKRSLNAGQVLMFVSPWMLLLPLVGFGWSLLVIVPVGYWLFHRLSPQTQRNTVNVQTNGQIRNNQKAA